MPDSIARKRLKKKMLDRWENEGGRIVAETTSEDENRSMSKLKGKGRQSSASRESMGGPASLTKRRKVTPK